MLLRRVSDGENVGREQQRKQQRRGENAIGPSVADSACALDVATAADVVGVIVGVIVIGVIIVVTVSVVVIVALVSAVIVAALVIPVGNAAPPSALVFSPARPHALAFPHEPHERIGCGPGLCLASVVPSDPRLEGCRGTERVGRPARWSTS